MRLPCAELRFSTLLVLRDAATVATGTFLEHGHSLISCHLFVSEVWVELLKIKSQCVSREEEMVSSTENACTKLSPLVVLGNYTSIIKANPLPQSAKIGSVSSYSTYFCLFAEKMAQQVAQTSLKLNNPASASNGPWLLSISHHIQLNRTWKWIWGDKGVGLDEAKAEMIISLLRDAGKLHSQTLE